MIYLSAERAAEEMIEAGKRLWLRGLVSGTDGNISCRIGPDRILSTPTGISKASLEAGSFVLTDLSGNVIEGKSAPSTELKLHLAAYAEREDITAVIHAHPPAATAFASAGVAPDVSATAEAALLFPDGIPIAPYSLPGGQELAEGARECFKGHKAVLLERHGAVTLGNKVSAALALMEAVENAALTELYIRALGGAKPLDKAELEKLRGLSLKRGLL